MLPRWKYLLYGTWERGFIKQLMSLLKKNKYPYGYLCFWADGTCEENTVSCNWCYYFVTLDLTSSLGKYALVDSFSTNHTHIHAHTHTEPKSWTCQENTVSSWDIIAGSDSNYFSGRCWDLQRNGEEGGSGICDTENWGRVSLSTVKGSLGWMYGYEIDPGYKIPKNSIRLTKAGPTMGQKVDQSSCQIQNAAQRPQNLGPEAAQDKKWQSRGSGSWDSLSWDGQFISGLDGQNLQRWFM